MYVIFLIFRNQYLVIKFEESEPSTNVWTPDSEIKLISASATLSSSSSTVSIYKVSTLTFVYHLLNVKLKLAQSRKPSYDAKILREKLMYTGF